MSLRERDPQDAEAVLKARCRTDRLLFAKTFFKAKLEHPFSRAHLAILEAPKTPFRERAPMAGWRRAWELPRGNGKTAIAVRIEIVHDIVYEFEEYVVILAEGAQLARSRVREIGLELEHNADVKHFFSELKGEPWRLGMGEFVTSNGVTVIAKSRQSQVRGLQHEITAARPTKVAGDDFESSQDVLNPELREKDARFWREDVEGGGTTDGRTCFQMSGTPLHREALLPGLAKNPGWDFRAFPAIERWPDRMDLWDRCRQVFVAAGAEDLPDEGGKPPKAGPGAVELAHEFYKANRRKMDAGAEVLWPEGEPLFALMVFRWTNGEAAFSKEKLLVPRDPALATFEMESEEYPQRGALRHEIVYDQRLQERVLVVDQRDGKTRRVPFHLLRFYTFHDPAKADPTAKKSARRRLLGDYAAIVTIGVEEARHGGRFIHVVDAWVERQPPSVQIATHFALAEAWKPERCVLEEDTLGLLRKDYVDEREKRKRIGEFWEIPLHALARQTTNKDARIAAMEPAVVNGWLTFNRILSRRFWHQWVDHPTGDHDDGPDATEGAWRCAGRKRPGLRAVRLPG
jgi:predicted phage terminase large subunit-like protein